MITKQQCDEFMSKHGFTCISYSNDGLRGTYSNLISSVSCDVKLDTNEFSLKYSPPASIAVLSIDYCSPLIDLPEQNKEYKQFLKMYSSFIKLVNKLQKG